MTKGGGEEQGLCTQAGGSQACKQGLRLAGGGCQGGYCPLVGVLPQARGKRCCSIGRSA